MDNTSRQFQLLLSSQNEMQLKLFQGRLESEGMQTRMSSASLGASKTSAPDRFGLYVLPQDYERALALNAESRPYTANNRPLKIFAIGILCVFGLAISILILSKFL